MRKIMLLVAAIAICSASAPLALGQIYRPSTCEDQGNIPTLNPSYAYDGNTATYASLNGNFMDGDNNDAMCTWTGFPSYTPSGSLTLNILLAVPTVSNGTVTVRVVVSGQIKASFSYTSPLSETTDQWTVPAGTNLDTISVFAEAFGRGPEGSAAAHVYEIWVQ
jgi:hypothetical protein